MDLPLPSMERASTARPRFRMAKPGTAIKNESNKAFEVIGTKACLNLNADVGSENNGLLRAQRTLHHWETKVTNHAGTISESEARNSQ